MKKFFAAAAIACGLALSALVPPAMAQRAVYRGAARSRATGMLYHRYEPYQGGNFWAINYAYDGYPDNASGSSVASPDDQVSSANEHFLFTTPGRGGYYHSDVYQPPYGAAAYALLAASKTSGAVSQLAPANGSNPATIRLTLPDPNARVSFDDTRTQQTGTNRLFTSPTLEPGKFYTYKVRATWTENGQETTRTKDVVIQAGRTTTVDFRDQVASGER
jgi:uncharacterized protein (TIGR03000 family)